VVGIFPNEESITRLIGAVLMEANDEWQLQHRYMQVEGMAEPTAPLAEEQQTETAQRRCCGKAPPSSPFTDRIIRDASYQGHKMEATVGSDQAMGAPDCSPLRSAPLRCASQAVDGTLAHKRGFEIGQSELRNLPVGSYALDSAVDRLATATARSRRRTSQWQVADRK
jgi:hypothetical protein